MWNYEESELLTPLFCLDISVNFKGVMLPYLVRGVLKVLNLQNEQKRLPIWLENVSSFRHIMGLESQLFKWEDGSVGKYMLR